MNLKSVLIGWVDKWADKLLLSLISTKVLFVDLISLNIEMLFGNKTVDSRAL